MDTTQQEEGNTKLEWILNKYQVDNITKMDLILKWCRFDNDNIDDTELDGTEAVFRLVYQIKRTNNSFSDYEDKYGNNNNDIYGFTIIFFESVCGIIMTQMYVPCNGLYDGEQRLLCIII